MVIFSPSWHFQNGHLGSITHFLPAWQVPFPHSPQICLNSSIQICLSPKKDPTTCCIDSYTQKMLICSAQRKKMRKMDYFIKKVLIYLYNVVNLLCLINPCYVLSTNMKVLCDIRKHFLCYVLFAKNHKLLCAMW